MIKKALEGIITVVIISLILLLVFFAINKNFGIHPILSGSMEPNLKTGGMVLISMKPSSEIVIGDIILFNNDQKDRKLVHRVIDILEKEGQIWFQTKGDANEQADEKLIAAKQGKIGKVIFHIPYLGFIVLFVKKNIAIIVSLIALSAAFWLLMEIKNFKKEESEKLKEF